MAEISASSRRGPRSADRACRAMRAAARQPASVTTRATVGWRAAARMAPVPASQQHALNWQVRRRPCRTRKIRLPNSASPRTSRKSFSRIRPMKLR